MKIIVYRDAENKVINIGEWDYMITLDDSGGEVANNPLPEGLTSQVEDVVVNPDGSRSTVRPLYPINHISPDL